MSDCRFHHCTTVVALTVTSFVSCLPAPQRDDEVALSYRAAFTSTPSVSTAVWFPFVADGTADTVRSRMTVSDGGQAGLEDTGAGKAFKLAATGSAEARFSFSNVKGLSAFEGIPPIALTGSAADGGVNVRLFKVELASAAQVNVEFEYFAQQNCGTRCGGSRRFQFSGPLQAGVQSVELQVTEMENRQ
jgi:hypothetical protein